MRAGATTEEYEEFRTAEATYLEQRKEFLKEISDDLIDEAQQHIDYVSGEWGRDGYQTPYRRPNPAMVGEATDLVASGELNTNIEQTLADALQLYLDISLSSRNTNALKQKRFRQAKERAVTGFAEFIGQADLEAGMATKLVDISRMDARRHYETQLMHSKPATVGRKFGDPQSIYIKALVEHELVGKKADPFAGIRNKKL